MVNTGGNRLAMMVIMFVNKTVTTLLVPWGTVAVDGQ